MAEPFVEPGRIRSYHAHIYYNRETRAVAERLREAIGNRFSAELGRRHDEPVGPHPVSMYQVAFPVAEFPRLVPWLMLNHAGLLSRSARHRVRRCPAECPRPARAAVAS